MKIWIGEEREGRDVGINTLFVQEQKLTKNRLKKVAEIAKNRNVSRIYFGAGKKAPLYIHRDWRKIMLGYACICETTQKYLRLLPAPNDFEEIIVRVDLPKGTNYRIKTDNKEEVVVYYEGLKNSLSTVYNKMYDDTDILIYYE